MERVFDVQCSAASRRIEPYKSEGHRAVIIAGVQGGLCALVVFESAYG